MAPSAYDFVTLQKLAEMARRGREKVDETQEDAAERLGVEQSTVSDAENADTSYKRTIFLLVAEYTDYEVAETEHYQLRPKDQDE